MSVYVDELTTVCVRSKRWPYSHSCHLVADCIEELHSFARGMRLKRTWFQDQSSLPHYDLTKNFRILAVKLGAIEIDAKKLVELMRKYRLEKAGK